MAAPIRAFFTSDANKEPETIGVLLRDPSGKLGALERAFATETGKRLKKRMALGYTFLKMDLGLAQIMHVPGGWLSIFASASSNRAS